VFKRDVAMPRENSRASSYEINPDDLYDVLGNQNRRTIILFLGQRNGASFSELRKALKISVGNLYYNLDALQGYVEKDANKRYVLTERGKILYNIIKEESRRIEHTLRPKSKLYRFYQNHLRKIIFPEAIFISMYKDERLASIAMLITFSMAIVLVNLGNLDLTLFELSKKYYQSPAELVNLGVVSLPRPLWLVVKLLVSWLGITALLDLICRLLGHREWEWEMLSATLVAFLPIFSFSLLENTLIPVIAAAFSVDYLLVSYIIYRTLQVLTLTYLASTISIFKHLPLDRALLIAFALFYISYVTNLVLRRAFPLIF